MNNGKRKKTERDIKPSGPAEKIELYQLALHSLEYANVAVFLADRDGKFIYVNKAACKLFGYSRDELLSKTVFDLTPEYSFKTWRESWRKLKKANKILRYSEARRKDGTTFPVEVFIAYFECGKKKYHLAVVNDITDRKKAEESLLHEINLTDSVINSLPGIFYFFGENGNILRWNRNAETVTGYSAEEVPNLTVLDFFAAKDRVVVEEAIKEVFLKGQSTVEANLLSKDKKSTPYLFTGLRFLSNGRKYLIGMGLDISERKRVETELKANERFLTDIFSSIQDGVSVLDKDFNIISVNLAGEKWHAHNMPLVGKKCYEAFHSRTKRCEICPTYRTLKSGKAAHAVIPMGGVAGKIVGWLDLYSFPLVDAQTGKLKGVIEYARDITGRKKAEDALRESEERYRTLVNSAPDVIYSISADDQTILSLNPVFEKITGWSRDKWIGKKFSDLIHPEDIPIAVKTFEQALNGEITPLYELRIRAKSGDYLVGEFVSTPLIEHGKIVGELGIVRDITERKKALEALKRTQFCVDNVGEGVAWVTPEGRFLYVNDQLCKITGYSREELKSLSVSDIDVYFTDERWREYWKRLKSVKHITFESEHYMKDKTTFPVEITANYLKFGDQELDFGFVRDITERKKIERMKDNLIRNVSHELKTPIAVTEMAYEMCDRAIKSNDIKKIKRAHKIAYDNIKRVRTDIDNILTAFALERKKTTLKKRVSLSKMTGSILKNMDSIVRDKGLKIKLNLPKSADEILADEKEMTVLFNNIIDNAVKFTDRGSISISSRLKDKWIYVKIKDTGAGIIKDAIDKVFDPFFKQSPSIRGTGLGLSICRELAENNGGGIKAFSKGPGKGTTITVKLPLWRRQRPM